jgi:hypothetical protein
MRYVIDTKMPDYFVGAPICSYAVHGSRCILMDSSIIGDRKKACFLILQRNHVFSYARSWYCR